MDLQLRGKRALVTGSTAGIGLAAAAGLYREGATVVINGRTPHRVEEAVAGIRGLGGDGEVSGIAADLSTAEGVDELVRQLPEVDEGHGRPDPEGQGGAGGLPRPSPTGAGRGPVSGQNPSLDQR
jgi:NAD(P)-dependent dehydrogenase (short-subunit alcohol dehydrogenase family)